MRVICIFAKKLRFARATPPYIVEFIFLLSERERLPDALDSVYISKRHSESSNTRINNFYHFLKPYFSRVFLLHNQKNQIPTSIVDDFYLSNRHRKKNVQNRITLLDMRVVPVKKKKKTFRAEQNKHIVRVNKTD